MARVSRRREEFRTELLDRFIDMLRASRSLRAPGLEVAFRDVPRHVFVDRYYDDRRKKPRFVNVDRRRPSITQLRRIYTNDVLTTGLPPGAVSSTSQPSLMAEMLAQLQLERGMNVLEIGAGTGWNAALMGHIVGPAGCVSSIELDRDIALRARRNVRSIKAANVSIVAGDGANGHKRAAPFDRIITAVGCPDVFPAWVDQLKEGGLLLITLQSVPHGGGCLLSQLRKQNRCLTGEVLGTTWFIPFRGRYGRESDSPEKIEERLSQGRAGRRRRRRLAPWICMHRQAKAFRIGDLLMMAYLEGMTVEQLGNRLVISSPSSNGVCIADEDHIDVYGHDDAYEAFEAVAQQWLDRGAPARSEYRIEVWPKGVRKFKPKDGWLVQRDHSQLIFRPKTRSS